MRRRSEAAEAPLYQAMIFKIEVHPDGIVERHDACPAVTTYSRPRFARRQLWWR